MTDSPFHITAVLHSVSPGLTRANPPGQAALTYRAGDYATFVARMLRRLHSQTVPDLENRPVAPLAAFNILAGDDWTIALLRAWAMVADVLAFYQERLINEGYLRTATESRSVLELARMVGYELAPPIAAVTHLAFSVQAESGTGPAQPLLIRRGTAVQSTPPPFSSHDAVKALVAGSAAPVSPLPVTFETLADLTARAAWNNLTPARFLGQPWPPPQTQPRRLRLAGAQTGLKPGDGLLIVSADPAVGADPAAWELLLLDGVEPQAAAGVTAVSWRRQFGHVPPQGIPNPAVYALRSQAPLFAYSAGPVFRDTDSGWFPANIGLPGKPVLAAAANRRGRVFVATAQTVYQSPDLGDTWQPLTGLPPKNYLALAAADSGALAAGSDDGAVYLSPDGGDAWTPLSGPGEVETPQGWRRFVETVRHKLPKTTIRALLHTGDPHASPLAGTDDGVFGYDARRDSWRSLNGRFPDVNREKGTAKQSVHALTAAAGRIFAGTGRGVYVVSPLFNAPDAKLLAAFLAFLLALPVTLGGLLGEIDAWTLATAVHLAGLLVLLLFLNWLQPGRLKIVALFVTLLFYATAPWWRGALLGEGPPDPFTMSLTPAALLLVACIAANAIFAALCKLPGLAQKTVPASWQPRAPQPQVLALLAAEETVYAGTDAGLFTLPARPGYGTRLWRWLQRLILGPQPEPLTAVPLWPAGAATAHTVTALAWDDAGRLVVGTQSGVIAVRHGDDWRPEPHVSLGEISALVNANDTLLAAGTAVPGVEARWALAQLQAGHVDLSPPPPGAPGPYAVAVDADSVALLTITDADAQPSRDAQRPGPLLRLTVAETAVLANFNRAHTRLYLNPQRLALADDLFQPQPVAGEVIRLDGRWPGLNGRMLALSGTAVSGGRAGELVTVQRAEVGETGTQLTLAAPLRHAYVRESVTLYGNVVAASHGETVTGEPLGESDGAVSNQRFSLRRPLAYLPDDAGDYVSSLSVQVSGIPWQKVPTLLDQPPDGRVYMVRRDDAGQATLIFGDGQQGARLPTSRERLTAAYRAGGGAAGNLPPGSLTLLPSRLPRLKGVTNPLPARGGQPAEAAGQARQRAPQRLRALGRIVTLRDFVDFAAAFPGVGKAAVHRPPGRDRLALAVAARDGQPLAADDPLLARLATAIAAVRVAPTPRLTLRPYEPVIVPLALAVVTTPEIGRDAAARQALQTAVVTRLLHAFGFAARELGQPLTEAEIFAVVQEVRGVTAVSINHEPATAVLWYQLLRLDAAALTVEVR